MSLNINSKYKYFDSTAQKAGDRRQKFLLELSSSGKLKKIFLVYKVRLYTSFSSVSFPSLFRRTRHGGVGQRSGTRLETPLLGWALPLKILNHVSLGVDVPVFFHPGDVASFSHFFSSIHYVSMHSQLVT